VLGTLRGIGARGEQKVTDNKVIRRACYSLRARLAAACLLGLLSACATAPIYSQKVDGASTGYTDERLAQNRFRVTYTGGGSTVRETVEDFLLFRAAQVTLESRAAWFAFDTRDTSAHTTYLSSFNGFPRGPGFGWRDRWDWWPDDGAETTAITRYQAYAEIVTLSEAQAHTDPHALNAQDVITRLGPKVLPPPQATTK
jgi:hypothetical protein